MKKTRIKKGLQLFNRTDTIRPGKRPAIPDELLIAVVKSAARWIGCPISGCPVIIKYSTRRMSGTAYPDRWVSIHEMTGRKSGDYKTIRTDGGYIEIAIPFETLQRANMYTDKIIGRVESIWQIIVHEFAHIMDFREGDYIHSERDSSGRRIPHDKRRGEIRVYDRIAAKGISNPAGFASFYDDVSIPDYVSNAILNLALWIEENITEPWEETVEKWKADRAAEIEKQITERLKSEKNPD